MDGRGSDALKLVKVGALFHADRSKAYPEV